MEKKINKNKRVLIISNNVLSTQNNNGKTLLSFFRDVPKEKLSQLYFSAELADSDLASNYYQVSDSYVLEKVLKNKKNNFHNDSKIKRPTESNIEINANKFKESDLVRLARELVWKIAGQDSEKLSSWVKEISPEIIFFCAGDSLFAYDYYEKVCQLVPSARKVVYITDDYILPRKKISPFWWARRHLIHNKMKLAAVKADVFVTISEEMREQYKKILGKDSITVFNMPPDLKIEGFEKTNRSDLVLAYIGGLHFERWKTLNALAIAVAKFNEKYNRKILLKIFSHQQLNERVIGSLNIDNASNFCGGLNENEVRFELNDADILVHVESFNPKCIESTRLSISTKIAEYLSVGKPIMAIGPGNLASISFLNELAYCVKNIDDLDDSSIYELCNGNYQFMYEVKIKDLKRKENIFMNNVFQK